MAYIDTKEAAKVFVSSTFAGIFTDAFVNGLSDPVKPLNKANAVFNGLQLGTNFIAYPVAQRILHDNLPKERKEKRLNLHIWSKRTFNRRYRYWHKLSNLKSSRSLQQQEGNCFFQVS